jgi:hypothetical protein
MTTLLDAARDLAQRGWPVMPVKPRSKEPLTPHGVKDATTTERTILHWFDRWPEANLAIATGAPGPTVLDIDHPDQAKAILAALGRLDAPIVVSVRGRHYYFRGTEHGTVSLGYGELRGRGSYILVPPSTHPTGKQYVWLHAPHGPLPRLPDLLTTTAATTGTAGLGDFTAPELIPHGGRHDALKDAAVRFLRGGFTDVPTLEQMLEAFFHARCDPRPPPRKGEFRKLAEWATTTRLAERERNPEPEDEKPKKTKKAKKLDKPPKGDAPLAEHREYVRVAGGWGNRIDINNVKRYGTHVTDALRIELSNGQRINFDRQDHVTTRGHWARTVIACTNGIADPSALTDWEGQKVFRSLCILADAPPERVEEERLEDVVADFIAQAEAVAGHNFADTAGRYDVTARCRARATYDPRNRGEDAPKPALVIDQDGERYVRAGELQDYLNYRGLGITASALSGRMAMIGFQHVTVNGREPVRPDDAPRRTNRMQLYQLPRAER